MKRTLKVALPLVILVVVVIVFWLIILPLPSVQAWADE